MNKSKLVVGQPTSFVYTLPADTVRVQGLGMAMGCMAALRDYPQVQTSRDAIEAQARTGCLSLNVFFASPGWQLTNDFSGFCELLKIHWIRLTSFGEQFYRENWQSYRELYPEVDAPAPGVE